MAGQVAERMPLATRVDYAQLYDAFQWYAQKASDETDAWSVLGELDDPGILARPTCRCEAGAFACSGSGGQDGCKPPRIVAAASRFGIKPQRVSPSRGRRSIRALWCRPLH